MALGWRVLDATSFEGIVSARPGSLTLTRRGESDPVHIVPAAEVAVLLIGVKTSVTAAALHRMTSHDIVLLASDWRGVPVAGLYPWSDHGRVAARHIAQAGLALPRKKNAWMQIVRAKVAGQAATLRPLDLAGADRLNSLVRSVRSGDPGNVEGTAARMYWARLFSGDQGSFQRNPDSEDNRNSQLNYGYAVLRGYGIRAVLAAGLSPPLGLFHCGRSNYFNLVDDLIEPFRPAIDAIVTGLDATLSPSAPEVKHTLVSAASQVFSPDGKRIPTVLTELAQQLGRYVEGDIGKLTVPRWNGSPQPSNRAEPQAGDCRDGIDDWEPPW